MALTISCELVVACPWDRVGQIDHGALKKRTIRLVCEDLGLQGARGGKPVTVSLICATEARRVKRLEELGPTDQWQVTRAESGQEAICGEP